uniref:HSF_DOMAIN domain-containing protein n=1 Tax=Parastrongyloides trichosuri TaxID=131310 RepID=A0A0N4ZQK2_PARTI
MSNTLNTSLMSDSTVRRSTPSISRALAVQGPMQVLREDDKTPVFLVKLWNIVNDPALDHIIEWDESGLSFHIKDSYAFCKEVLPQYFKHGNLNSCVRQLNMYGFRKITTIEKSSLIGCQNAADNLEFSHPYFVRGRYDLLCNIKRKLSTPKVDQQAVAAIEEVHSKGTNQFNKALIDEIKQLRDRQIQTERRVATLLKQNETIWKEMEGFRAKHRMQQSVIKKLCGIIDIIGRGQPQPKRIGKRQLLAIGDDDAKKSRMNDYNFSYITHSGNSNSEVFLDSSNNDNISSENNQNHEIYLEPYNPDEITILSHNGGQDLNSNQEHLYLEPYSNNEDIGHISRNTSREMPSNQDLYLDSFTTDDIQHIPGDINQDINTNHDLYLDSYTTDDMSHGIQYQTSDQSNNFLRK